MPEAAGEETPFTRLGVGESPWVDVEALQARHRELMSVSHPDTRLGQEERRTAEHTASLLNEDLGVLSDPVRRLDWMLRRGGVALRAGVPAEGEALFLPLGRWMREVDGLKRTAAGAGALERAGLAQAAAQLVVEGNRLALQVSQDRRRAEEELRELGRTWREIPDWEGLRDLHWRLSYLQKWGRELGERQFALAGILG